MHLFNPRVLGPLALLVLLVALWSPHIRHVDALGEEEIVALAEIFASSPTLFSAYGWTQDFASACDANSTFSYTLTCADGHITRLDFLPGLHPVTGTLPLIAAWGNLPHLESIIVTGMGATGTIPPSIGQLSNLTILNLAFNQLSGTIPDLTGTSLIILDLSHNYLSGTISSQLLSLPILTSINLSYNNLNGSLPAQVPFSPVFEQLTLSHNYLSGSIPSTWTAFRRPTLLALDNNRFTGTIPSNIFQSNILLFAVLNNRLDICSGDLNPPPRNLDACAILPQYYHMTTCNCTEKWRGLCGDIPAECPDCTSPQPSAEFKCSDYYGWFADSVLVGAGQSVDFSATSQNTPAIIMDRLVVQASGTLKFGLDSSLKTYGVVDLQGDVKIQLSKDDANYISNQFSGQYLEKKYNTVTRTYISQIGASQDIRWNPAFVQPNICNTLNISHSQVSNAAPWTSTYYQASYTFTSKVKFRCSSWVIVLSVFGGVILLTLIVVLGCIVYTRWQKKKGEERLPLLYLQ